MMRVESRVTVILEKLAPLVGAATGYGARAVNLRLPLQAIELVRHAPPEFLHGDDHVVLGGQRVKNVDHLFPPQR